MIVPREGAFGKPGVVSKLFTGIERSPCGFIPQKPIGLALATVNVLLRREAVKKLVCFPFFFALPLLFSINLLKRH